MLVIAHRGASAIEPENTLLAIEAALNAKAGAIEFDVQAVRSHENGDIKLMAIHDRYLERSTNGQGRVIDWSYEALRKLDAGKQQQIPTLREKLKLMAEHHHKCMINIELKDETTLEPALLDINYAVEHLGLKLKHFLLSSFYHGLLVEAKKQLPQLKTGALIAHCPLDLAKFAQALDCFSLNLSVECINQQLVNDAKKRGLKVYVYTVDEVADIKDMLALGVDGIFSNHPERAAKIIATLNQ